MSEFNGLQNLSMFEKIITHPVSRQRAQTDRLATVPHIDPLSEWNTLVTTGYKAFDDTD